jgi:hypothetical protein
MLIERRGAKRSHRQITLARSPAHVVRADGTNWAIFVLQGRYGVPDTGTTHMYTVMLSREEIVEALKALLGESSQPKLSKPLGTMLRELLKRGRG